MSDGVSVRLEEVEIPTYPPPVASPYCRFGWAGRRGTYPYSTKTDLSAEPVPMTHRVVTLENEYLLVAVTPDLGGRVYRMYDKVAGQETFMVPPTMKFQNVSNRGAWLAGGIEFNFGHRGHTCHTVSPVSWAMRNDPDGGASVWVGTVIRPIGSRWAIRIRLAPARAALDLEVHTMGPPALPAMMYYWSNAGVEVTRQSRFFYYGLYANALHFQHGWPICDGLDYTWYRNRHIEADMFLMDAQRDYLGFYDYTRGHGLAQTADAHQAPGQKYVTCGTHMQGQYWDLMFSDTEQTYCEIQRGRLPTQGMTEAIPAMACEAWTETWMPIAGAEGFSAAENDLVLSVVVADDGSTCIRLLGVSERRDLRLSAFSGEAALGDWPVERVAPGEMFTRRVTGPAGGAVDRVTVLDATGQTLLDWTEFHFRQDDWFRDSIGEIETGPGPVDQRFAEAERLRLLRWPDGNADARRDYEGIIEEDPGHSGARGALAQLCSHAGQFDDAVDHLNIGLRRRPYDPDLLTALGWALMGAGDVEAAVGAFAKAARQEAHRRPALVGLASAHLRAGRVKHAAASIERLLAESPRDKWARLTEVIVLRKAGQTDLAVERLRPLLEAEPIWSALHAEAVLLGVETNLAGGSRTLADDSVTAATPYIEMGQWADARVLLERDESDEPFSPAVRLAHLAWACRQLGDADGERAAVDELHSATDELANPWTTASIALLTGLAEAWPDEPMLPYMLGNVLSDRARLEEAEAAWRRAADLGLESSVLQTNIAGIAMHTQRNDEALAAFRKAWALADRGPNLFSLQDRFLASLGRHDDRQAAYDELDEATRDRSLVAMRRLPLLLDQRRYDEALDEIGKRNYLRGEGEKTIRYQYLEALVGKAAELIAANDLDAAEPVLARGLEYPRNLNTGRHEATPNEAIINYWMGLLAELRGQADRAREYWVAASQELHHEGHPIEGYEMLGWLALGQRYRALDIAHKAEQRARGEEDIPWWHHFHFGSGAPQLNHGLSQLVKGHVDRARRIWAEALQRAPDARWLGLHAALPDDLLARMARKATGPL